MKCQHRSHQRRHRPGPRSVAWVRMPIVGGLILLFLAGGIPEVPASDQAPRGPHAPAVTLPDFLGGIVRVDIPCQEVGMWVVLEWGALPSKQIEFVCLGEGQGVPRRCMIHHGLSRGIFTPWPWVGPLGQREAFFASQHAVSGRQAPQAWHSGGPFWMGHVRRGLSLDFPPLPKLANLLLQLCLLQV